mmetsp:Transcript_44702/g.129178  ORF Transcript_44702/g.129178 Transcript_44702/m.129178 type:complete len:292 (+) Transcript_44702:95-970(+)
MFGDKDCAAAGYPKHWHADRSASHDGASLVHLLQGRRGKIALADVVLELGHRLPVLGPIPSEPTADACDLVLPHVLRLEQVVATVHVVLRVDPGGEAPRDVGACQHCVRPVGAIFVWTVGHVKDIAVHRDEVPPPGVLETELLERLDTDDPHGLLVVGRQVHVLWPLHRLVPALQLQALLLKFVVLVKLRTCLSAPLVGLSLLSQLLVLAAEGVRQHLLQTLPLCLARVAALPLVHLVLRSLLDGLEVVVVRQPRHGTGVLVHLLRLKLRLARGVLPGGGRLVRRPARGIA